jgi:hypothetical protein
MLNKWYCFTASPSANSDICTNFHMLLMRQTLVGVSCIFQQHQGCQCNDQLSRSFLRPEAQKRTLTLHFCVINITSGSTKRKQRLQTSKVNGFVSCSVCVVVCDQTFPFHSFVYFPLTHRINIKVFGVSIYHSTRYVRIMTQCLSRSNWSNGKWVCLDAFETERKVMAINTVQRAYRR